MTDSKLITITKRMRKNTPFWNDLIKNGCDTLNDFFFKSQGYIRVDEVMKKQE